MSNDWYCANCDHIGTLNRHLRCGHCGSDAVDLAVRPMATVLGIASAFLTEAERDWMLIEEAGKGMDGRGGHRRSE